MNKKTICYLLLGLSILIFSVGAIHLLAAINPAMCEREPQVASCNDLFLGSCRVGGGCFWNRSFVAMDCTIACKNYILDASGNCILESAPDIINCEPMAH